VIDILNERGEILAAYRAALDEHRARLEQIDREQDTQLKRIAQLQADVDRLRQER
jgi:multidrug resistance efflux pump